MPKFAELGAWISGILNDPKVTAGLTAITNWISNALESLQEAFKEGGIGGLIKEGVNQMIDGFKNVWTVIKDPVIAGLKSLWEFMKPIMIEAWQGMIKLITPYWNVLVQKIGENFEDWIFHASKGLMFGGKEYSDRRGNQMFIDKPEVQDFIKNQLDKARKEKNEAKIEEFSTPSLYRDQVIRDYMESLRGTNRQGEINPQQQRATGTWGMTGQLTEPTTTVAQIEAGETVLTPEQRNAMLNAMNGGAGNNLNDALNRLNSMTAQMTHALQDIAKYSKQNVDATRALNGNLLA
jgi:hypothetical protein